MLTWVLAVREATLDRTRSWVQSAATCVSAGVSLDAPDQGVLGVTSFASFAQAAAQDGVFEVGELPTVLGQRRGWDGDWSENASFHHQNPSKMVALTIEIYQNVGFIKKHW